ncbi:glutamate racemase [Ramlibacter sp. H39-3-26]|uniref:glutamate racemase n=1 Tax=Curvibacter soli TaxID=3031331 RepID=UPI0023DB016B|nr:glutamate racemase [Ramlibacter sp. H39-3-26]MDF1485362.1 glutamate racemase [Ramlibacter sp. H39-3-26]
MAEEDRQRRLQDHRADGGLTTDPTTVPAQDATDACAPIGVFDSGIGGLSVLRALRAELPHEDFVYLADSGHAPYGERGDAYVTARSQAIAGFLHARHGIKALVVACNTATAAAIHLLRERLPGLPIVGVEPAIKPAVAASRTGRVGVIATRGTLGSAKFQQLLRSQEPQARFTLQPCDGLALAIERSAHPGSAENATEIRALCARYISAMGPFGMQAEAMDTLVLGCTHYVFAQAPLRQLLPAGVALIDTGAPVARHTRRLLGTALNPQAGDGATLWLSTGEAAELRHAAKHLLGLADAPAAHVAPS